MIPGSASPLLLKSAAAAGGYQIERSLRFNSSDSAFLSRTPAVAGNRRTWTWAGWVKRSGSGSRMDFFSTNIATSGNYLSFQFSSSNAISLGYYNGEIFTTSAVYRDFSAWMHVVFTLDTTLATATDRVKLYVNGSRVTTFSTDNISSVLTLNSDQGINAVQSHSIGRNDSGANVHFNGYLADIHFIDGQALTPSSFTEVSATTGQLIPKAYAGTYTGNSFWLKFNDNSAATATTLGKDSFLLGNNWTPNNLSVTAGAGNDSLVDTPTSYGTDTSGVGGVVRGNYATLNPLDNSSGMTLANGNLDGSETGGGHKGTRATIKFPASGKWYYEGTVTTLGGACCIGAATNAAANPDINASGSYYILVNSSGNVQRYQSFASYTGFDTPAVGTILRVAYDADAQKLWLGLNGLWMNSSTGTTGDPATGANATFSSITDIYPAINQYTSAVALNFGQRAFAYTAPSGFKALCDTNLPAPLVALPNTLMDVSLWTGNGTQTIVSGLQYSPDFVWIKSRSTTAYHMLFDVVRGAQARLHSNTTDQEQTGNNDLTSFNSDGYTLDNNSSPANTDVNGSGITYVGWSWDAGTTTASNTQGSITSQVRANVSAGFSIVTYTFGNVPTVGHGLGVAPSLIITKSRTVAVDWVVYHRSLGKDNLLVLNGTGAGINIANYWGTSEPNSTVFGVYGTGGNSNNQGNMVAYCFAPVVGYSSFGSYTGNGSADGPFVYTGFRPKWILVKRTDAVDDWPLMDTVRTPANPQNAQLYPNFSNAESSPVASSRQWDALSNGFKLRGDNGAINASGGTYIYMAFAENPFQYARAR